MSTIGSRIRAARQAAGLSQGELAVKCGWGDDLLEGQSRISNYERDKREPTLADLNKMAKVLETDAAELAFGHPLTADPAEERIIRNFRTADARGRDFILSSSESAAPKGKKKRASGTS